MGRIGNTLARIRNAVGSADDATRLADAEAELSAARDDVQAAINQWPAPSNDRRWIEALPRSAGVERGVADASVLVGGSKPTDSRLAVFDRAVEREERAKFAVASVKAAIDAANVLPVRVALANAVNVLTEKRQSANAGRLSVERARLYLTEAEGRLSIAVDALETAKTGAEARLEAAAVSGEAPVGASSLRSARVTEMDAQDDAEACRRALQRVEKSLEDAEADERVAQENADRAADAVMLTLLDRGPILAVERERFKRYAIFQHLTRLYDFHTCDQTQRQRDVDFAARHSLTADIDDWKEIQARAVEPLKAFRRALLADPNAEFTA